LTPKPDSARRPACSTVAAAVEWYNFVLSIAMPTTLSREDVLRIAELARLELTAEEVDLFGRQLGDILQYVEQIHGLDTSDVPPTSHVLNKPIDRPDVPGETLSRVEALANAPDAASEAGLFKVPRVIG
jgi:aspartyl-tRNA(Asn)/glutamyl-tRNA(Gln) amidotransferase subunit C